MINEWKKVVNTITTLRYFRLGRLLCVLAFVNFLGLSTKRHFHLRWKRFAHADHETLHQNLPLCPEKAKQDFESLDSDWRRIDKGFMRTVT